MLKIPSKGAYVHFSHNPKTHEISKMISIVSKIPLKFQGPKFKDQHGSNFLFVLPMKILKESPSKVGYFRTIAEIFMYICIP